MSPRKKSIVDPAADPRAVSDQKPDAKTTNAEAGDPCKYFLSRERILTAALSIIDNEGFEALTMRRLGKSLNVDPMSIYYHVPNKTALLDGLVEVVMSSIDISVDDPSRTPEERLMTAARVYREALLVHPGLIQAIAARAPRTPASLLPVEKLVGIFVDAGLNLEDSFSSMNVLASFVRGAVIREITDAREPQDPDEMKAAFAQLAGMLPPDDFPHLVKVFSGCDCFDLSKMFDRGVRALIRGLLEMYGNKEEVEHDV